MATPFSPYVGRRLDHLKRRQSELPSDLIDWDAPEIPELEKQRIIYEDFIRETKEDHEVELLINEEIFKIAHEALLEHHEDILAQERNRVHLLLKQVKMLEDNQRLVIADLEKLKEEKTALGAEMENLAFRNNELNIELNEKFETICQKKNENQDMKRLLDSMKNQLTFYKKLAKNKE